MIVWDINRHVSRPQEQTMVSREGHNCGFKNVKFALLLVTFALFHAVG